MSQLKPQDEDTGNELKTKVTYFPNPCSFYQGGFLHTVSPVARVPT